MLVGDQALDERDCHQALAGAHRHDFVQQRRRIDDGLACGALERKRLVAGDDRELATLVGRGVGDEYRTRQIRAETGTGELDDRRVGMCAVLHSRLISAQQRRRDAPGHREIDELARARERCLQDLHRLGVLRVARVGLLVLLCHVGGIRRAPIDEPEPGGQLVEARDLRGASTFLICRNTAADWRLMLRRAPRAPCR